MGHMFPGAAMISRLILMSCGATEALRRARFARDEPLEPKALAQAQALAQFLPRADLIWCSPALGARQTAEALGLDAAPLDMLRDQSPGDWAGLTLDQVSALDPAALIAWATDPAAAPPGGESLTDIAQRLAPVLAGRLTTPGTLLAITHPAVIRLAAVLVLGAPLVSAQKIDIEPLTITDLRSDGRRWHLRSLGVPGLSGLR